MKTTRKPKNSLRTIVQILFAALINGYAAGFAKGRIYRGKLKKICVPVLNCYSCPAATLSCPIGALQNALLSDGFMGLFYVAGTISLFGILLGRLVCGFVCPFGFLQDLLYKIPSRKIKVPNERDMLLKKIKYPALFLVVGLPILSHLFANLQTGLASPIFCKFICPAGTLEGGLPLVIANPMLRSAVGILFGWKTLLLFFFLFFSVKISRPFCRYVCPLGAFYGILNRFSAFRLCLDEEKCTGCGLCEKVCPMQVKPLEAVTGNTDLPLTTAENKSNGKIINISTENNSAKNRASYRTSGHTNKTGSRECNSRRNTDHRAIGAGTWRIDSPDCIRCLKCAHVCPEKAISAGFRTKKGK